jgi:hypothetical protein
MKRAGLGFLSLLAMWIIAGSGPAWAQFGGDNQRFRDPISSMCRVSGVDAQGVTRIVLIRVDGNQSWDNVELVAATECRALYRLNNCAIISCRP